MDRFRTTSDPVIVPLYQKAPRPQPIVHTTTSIQSTVDTCELNCYEKLQEVIILPTKTGSDPRVPEPQECIPGPCLTCPSPYAKTYSDPDFQPHGPLFQPHGPGPERTCTIKNTQGKYYKYDLNKRTTPCPENAKIKYIYEVDKESEDFQRYGSPVDPPIVKDDTYPILLLQDSHLLKTKKKRTLKRDHWEEIDDVSLLDVSYVRPYSDLPKWVPYMEHIRNRVTISELKKRTYKGDFHFAPETSRPKKHELYIPPLLFVNQDAHNSTFIGYKPFPFKLHFEKYNPRPPPYLVSDGRLIVDVQREVILPITADTHATDFTLDY